MNIILLDPENTLADGLFALSSRQQTHISKVIKAQSGDVLRVGVLNGKIGEGIYEPPSEDRAGYIHSVN
ncbi:MAG: 16S rRNA (uracil(1498)-N(3))-methyltransferase, partial [Marinomonas sp.]